MAAAVAGLTAQTQLDRPVAAVNLTTPELIASKQIENRIQQLNMMRQQQGLPPVEASRKERLDVLASMMKEILIVQGAEYYDVEPTEKEISQVIENQRLAASQQNQREISMTQFRQGIEQQTGMSWQRYRDELRKQIATQKFIMQEKGAAIKALITPPDDEDIEYIYEMRANSFNRPRTVRYSQIFIRTANLDGDAAQKARERIYEALNKYENGDASFEELVLNYTEDTTAKYKDGDTGYLAINDNRVAAYFGENFHRQIFHDLEVGEVSGVIESNIGYHIVKVTESHPSKILELDEPVEFGKDKTVRQFLVELYMQEQQQKATQKVLDELVAELEKKSELSVFEGMGKTTIDSVSDIYDESLGLFQ